eukprot:scaffold25185_cov32-Prasinocladus_malaysianus.AAC.2
MVAYEYALWRDREQRMTFSEGSAINSKTYVATIDSARPARYRVDEDSHHLLTNALQNKRNGLHLRPLNLARV